MGDNWSERGESADRGESPDRGLLVFGAILVIVGAAFLGIELSGLDVGSTGWPLFIIVPGLALLVFGFAVGGEGGLGAAIPGGIITTVGLILAFQNATQTYASWAYMWALVAPGSVGVVLFLYGLLHGRPDLLEGGLRTAAVGGVLFVAFGLFFENLIMLDEGGQSTAMRDAMPVLAIVLGVAIVLTSLVAPRPRRRAWSDTDRPEGAGTPPPPSAS